jgi:hypothetical protein
MRVHFHFLFYLLLLSVLAPGSSILSGQGGHTIQFPLPPDPDGIGTHVGAINTHVDSVTLSPPASIHRLGLVYSEIRGLIRGAGWGGFDGPGAFHACHYTYELPYVLRIPPNWSGGLVIYRGQTESLETWEFYEATDGEKSFGRVTHEAADRYASDVALHPDRRWAFFAVNENPVAPGGLHNTLLVSEAGCVGGTPTASGRDIPIARDHARLAQRLLKILRDRDVMMTLGVGYSSGGQEYFLLNAGFESFNRGGVTPLPVGDNHRTPYDTASGRIFDGFLILDAAFVGAQQIPAVSLGFLSAPSMFVSGEVDRTFRFIPVQIGEIVGNPNLNARALSRFYTLRNVPVLYTDFTLSLKRESLGPSTDPDFFRGGGEHIKPLTAALLDALAKWGMEGIPPPTSVFNGEVKTGPDRIEFYRTSLPATAVPYVDDLSLDTGLFQPPTTPNANMRARWTVTRNALGATIGSIILPETACRRGGLNFKDTDGIYDTAFKPFDEATFLARWGSQSAFQSCRVQLTDALEAAGFYDPNFVTIDVDPERFPNVIDLGSKERLRVAIFSTAGFDAREIIPGTVRLATVSAQGVEKNPGNIVANVVDVNHDGRPDLVVEFRRDRLLLNPGEIIVDLWGSTRRGGTFSGSDVVQIVE